MTDPQEPPRVAAAQASFFTVHRIVPLIAVVIAALSSFSALITAALSQFAIYRDATTHFEETVGRPLLAPAMFASGAFVVAAALLLTTVRRSRPLLAWTSALLSVLSIAVSLNGTVEYRQRADPRPQLTRALESLDLGPDAKVVLRTNRALPDLPQVRWVYRLPLHKAETCARARAALETWAEPGRLNVGDRYACHVGGHRDGYGFTAYAIPDGGPLTRPPNEYEDELDPPVHYLAIEIGLCPGCPGPNVDRS